MGSGAQAPPPHRARDSMINSCQAARLHRTPHNDPVSEALASQAGPEEMSLAPSDGEINTRAAGMRSLLSWVPGEGIGHSTLCVLKAPEARGGGWVAKASKCLDPNSGSSPELTFILRS